MSMKYKFPNRGEFKYESGCTNRGCGVFLIFAIPIISLLTPGASGFYGGNTSFEDILLFMIVSIIIGIIIFVVSFLFPQQKITYKCSNCDYPQNTICKYKHRLQYEFNYKFKKIYFN
jgi:hypothetical protein